MDQDVTQWLTRLAKGDEWAARRIWERYYEQLVRLARRKLGRSPRRAADEEDVVLSAFEGFCRNAAAGRFSQLGDRYDLSLWLLDHHRQYTCNSAACTENLVIPPELLLSRGRRGMLGARNEGVLRCHSVWVCRSARFVQSSLCSIGRHDDEPIESARSSSWGFSDHDDHARS